ncbi:MAG: NADH-quinone oxidoreductase subunit NuoK [Candidatus Lambdaproteobacteria bacterium]|nr:NADH-quinone oxidoreductase subunit NuoK [Candidatus Lambdaproteobacteria bacterium]
MPVTHVLVLSAALFAIGVSGVILRRNAIVVFMSVELMLNAVNVAFVGFAYGLNSMTGIMFVLFVLVVAATEAVVGLAIMLAIFRNRGTLNIDEFNLLRW